jgi:hypothetical protein
MFRKKDLQVATGANERNIAGFNMRVNATAAADAVNVPYETDGRIAEMLTGWLRQKRTERGIGHLSRMW